MKETVNPYASDDSHLREAISSEVERGYYDKALTGTEPITALAYCFFLLEKIQSRRLPVKPSLCQTMFGNTSLASYSLDPKKAQGQALNGMFAVYLTPQKVLRIARDLGRNEFKRMFNHSVPNLYVNPLTEPDLKYLNEILDTLHMLATYSFGNNDLFYPRISDDMVERNVNHDVPYNNAKLFCEVYNDLVLDYLVCLYGNLLPASEAQLKSLQAETIHFLNELEVGELIETDYQVLSELWKRKGTKYRQREVEKTLGIPEKLVTHSLLQLRYSGYIMRREGSALRGLEFLLDYDKYLSVEKDSEYQELQYAAVGGTEALKVKTIKTPLKADKTLVKDASTRLESSMSEEEVASYFQEGDPTLNLGELLEKVMTTHKGDDVYYKSTPRATENLFANLVRADKSEDAVEPDPEIFEESVEMETSPTINPLQAATLKVFNDLIASGVSFESKTTADGYLELRIKM